MVFKNLSRYSIYTLSSDNFNGKPILQDFAHNVMLHGWTYCDILRRNNRNRSINFLPYNKKLLVKLATNRKIVLEDKKTDGQFNSSKNECWLDITEQFDSVTKSIKKDLRKADDGGREWKQTIGKASKPPLFLLTERETPSF